MKKNSKRKLFQEDRLAWEGEKNKRRLKDRTHQQSHFVLRWGAVDPASAPSGRPEAEEPGPTMLYRVHYFYFSPGRREHSWDILTNEWLLLPGIPQPSVIFYCSKPVECWIPFDEDCLTAKSFVFKLGASSTRPAPGWWAAGACPCPLPGVAAAASHGLIGLCCWARALGGVCLCRWCWEQIGESCLSSHLQEP